MPHATREVDGSPPGGDDVARCGEEVRAGGAGGLVAAPWGMGGGNEVTWQP